MAQQFGQRTILAVPLLRENKALGTIVLRRREVRPFEEKHVALLKTFADQAAIAIENVRLFNETKESLEQQTAISEVLRVISSTPSDVKPVLDAVADRAIRLCEAKAATIYVLEGTYCGARRSKGRPSSCRRDASLSQESLTGRTVAEGKAIHVPDIEQEQHVYPRSWQFAQKLGSHTMLSVPLMREGKPFGTMFLRRTEVRPFNDKQIALATTSPTRRRSPSRTYGSSTRRKRRSSSRRPRARCSAPSRARSPTPHRYSTRSSKAASGCSTPANWSSSSSATTLSSVSGRCAVANRSRRARRSPYRSRAPPRRSRSANGGR